MVISKNIISAFNIIVLTHTNAAYQKVLSTSFFVRLRDTEHVKLPENVGWLLATESGLRTFASNLGRGIEMKKKNSDKIKIRIRTRGSQKQYRDKSGGGYCIAYTSSS